MKRLVVIFFIIAVILISVVYAGLDAKDGKVVNVATPTAGTDAANKDYVDAHIVATSTPASTSATGTTGSIVWDNQYVYICIAEDSWLRQELNAWGDNFLLETGDVILNEAGGKSILE